MSKREQVLTLDPPNELHFKGPFTEVVTSCLKLINSSDKRVCFKVKTTAPKRYCVRPNNGLVEPKTAVTVAVMLQPFDYNPNDKNKHKFMVQTMFAPDGDINQDTLWKDVNPENLMDSKLKCVFDPPLDGTAQNNLDATLPAYDCPAPKLVDVSAKLSPKVSGISFKASTVEEELRKTSEELKRLEKENSTLRQENIQLKEDGLRQRRQHQHAEAQAAGSFNTDLNSPKAGMTSTLHPFPNSSSTNQPPTMMYVIIGVVAALVGLIFGKIF